MFRHRFDQNVNNVVIFHWFLLCFNGGAINVGGFLSTGNFVSHVTGFATMFGAELMGKELHIAFGLLSVPFFFLIGSFIAGLLIELPMHRNQKPHFDWVMGLCTGCLLLVVLGGELFHFGQFGEPMVLRRDYILLALLCLASGLQNAAIAASSGSSIRTTHLTGLTTDLGLGISRVFTFNLQPDKLKYEIKANYFRIGSILAFILGSSIGAWVFYRLNYWGFILPASISLYAALLERKKFNIHS
jgi:uncharacterized membrane protein YoaK (UPF0700 family)